MGNKFLSYNPLDSNEDVNVPRRFELQRGIRARVIADSINPDGDRLTTLECIFNRWILAELNTHRMLSRNSASSRAIPVKKIMRQVWSDPAEPVSWGSNRAGMQATSDLTGWRQRLARRIFLWARIPVLIFVWILTKLGLHKQVTNRLLEPWMWHYAIVSATEFDNFYKLRDHKDAQPEFQVLARAMRMAMDNSTPRKLAWGGWHLPYVQHSVSFNPDNLDWALQASKISAACCARVSYVRQNDRKSEDEDVKFTDRLSTSGHFSPLEHPAQAVRGRYGNFKGWKQLRKFYPGEDGVIKRVQHTCAPDSDIDNLYSDDCEACRV